MSKKSRTFAKENLRVITKNLQDNGKGIRIERDK